MLGKPEGQVNVGWGVFLRSGKIHLRSTQPNELDEWSLESGLRPYCSVAYSTLASFRMGMSGSGSGIALYELRKLQIKGVNFLATDVAQDHK